MGQRHKHQLYIGTQGGGGGSNPTLHINPFETGKEINHIIYISLWTGTVCGFKLGKRGWGPTHRPKICPLLAFLGGR